MNTKLDILKKIKSGEVDMKPQWHFVLKSLLLVLGVITAALLIIYLLSFVLFALRQSGVGFIPIYGFRGLSMFIMNSPWLLIASAAGLVVVLQLLVHKYSFSYRQPLLYSTIGVIMLVLLGSFIIDQTQFQSRMRGFAENRNTPVFSSLYLGIDEGRPGNIIFGTITEMTEKGFVIKSDFGETLDITITDATRQPQHKTYVTNEDVLVFGDREGSVVTALGVRPAPTDFKFNRHKEPGPKGTPKNSERPVFPPPANR
jgi:hypothetical protein